jgi:hypothetical protein
LKHFTAPSFWEKYDLLPENIRKLADQCFHILKSNPRHPSLKLKKICNYRSVRVGLHYRALAVEIPEGLLWFWIGNHHEYQRWIKKMG